MSVIENVKASKNYRQQQAHKHNNPNKAGTNAFYESCVYSNKIEDEDIFGIEPSLTSIKT